MLRLITIPISHYCEKARWSLQRAGIAYEERPHIQGIHRIAARRAGGGLTVPVLVTPDGAIGESQEILEWADQRMPEERRLLPGDPSERAEVESLCRRFDEQLGPAGRRLIYVHMMRDREMALSFNNAGVPRWEDRMTRFAWPAIERVIRRVLDIRPGCDAEDETIVWEEFDHAAELLADGRPFLSGSRFGAADLTFAALAAPMIVPPAYGVPLPQPAQMQADTAALISRAREHPAGAFALSLYGRREQL
ncbi:MAG TPA: glutathione S-transferase family protein [Solirubrobacteraceae bacterium]|nr:glutathione S-transferase family protein [Solirubrobacteraceae bacterium]